MSELVWGIKNGDIDQVKDIVEKNVSRSGINNINISSDHNLPILKVIILVVFLLFVM